MGMKSSEDVTIISKINFTKNQQNKFRKKRPALKKKVFSQKKK